MVERSELFITASGKAMLEAELQSCLLQLDELRKERLSSSLGARSAGKGVGACPLPDEELRHENRLEGRIGSIRTSLRARVAPAPKDAREVTIGVYVTLMYRRGISSKMVYEQFEVVGFNEADCAAHPPKLSYQSSHVAPFLGAQKGDYELLEREGKKRKVWVTRIRLVHTSKRKRSRK